MAEQGILLLQGGGALGAYQAGAFEALCEHGIQVDWIAGISIGAINAAIIAGNPPETRVARLREFWMRVSSGVAGKPALDNSLARMFSNEMSAALVATHGAPGFFSPRIVPPALAPAGTREALSYYDTSPLQATLDELVDFDLLNSGAVRVSVGAVGVRSGNFAYFDTHDRDPNRRTVGVRQIMASGALPPGFPPVEIDEHYYWDGGLVSNTPLQYVMDIAGVDHDAEIFQVDLFSAKGPMPRTLYEAAGREKDIRYSSRTRLNTDMARATQRHRAALRNLLERLPEQFTGDKDVELLRALCENAPAIALVHLIYRNRNYETQAKDYLFSRAAVLDHWAAGKRDVEKTLNHPEWKARKHEQGLTVYDLAGESA
ncbi:MAG: patatin-like phospholipase family protein [Rhizomicrobium sp.]